MVKNTISFLIEDLLVGNEHQVVLFDIVIGLHVVYLFPKGIVSLKCWIVAFMLLVRNAICNPCSDATLYIIVWIIGMICFSDTYDQDLIAIKVNLKVRIKERALNLLAFLLSAFKRHSSFPHSTWNYWLFLHLYLQMSSHCDLYRVSNEVNFVLSHGSIHEYHMPGWVEGKSVLC